LSQQSQSASLLPDRRRFLQAGLLAGVSAAAGPALAHAHADGSPAGFDIKSSPLEEITIAQLQDGMKSGKWSARSLAAMFLARIDAIDRHGPALGSVIEVNPDALAIADALDRERKEKKPRGPMHGIPVLIKDNIDTADRMATTAGSLALVGSKPPGDSFVARRLRQAGAVILGKANLSEWANIRSSHSSSGWSGRGGLTKNPFALDRNPSGSSSGSAAAVSASLCAVAVGTETNGSIISPSSACGVVGIKPTVGLVGRTGIIPISHSQDTAGPIARTVADAAILLGALAGADPEDKVTAESAGKSAADYTQFLDAKGLKGAHIGVARRFFGFNPAVDSLLQAALDAMKAAGAILVDPADVEPGGRIGASEMTVLLYELKADMNAYLARLGPAAPVHTLEEIIAFNNRHKEKELPYFGQDLFEKAQAKGPLTSQEYVDALARNQRLSRKEGIDQAIEKFKVDAFVAPSGGPAWVTDLVNGDHYSGGSSSPAAISGYPNITVPVGQIFGLPVGISFFGGAYSEPTLIKLAYAFEQATKFRKPPQFLPRVDLVQGPDR
jgi:amidase